MLAEAARRLSSAPSVRAKLTQRVTLGPAPFAARGALLEASGGRVRLALAFAFPDAAPGEPPARLLQVSDGAVLHTEYALGGPAGPVHVTRRNLRALREGRAAPDGGSAAGPAVLPLAAGGLTGLLATLRNDVAWAAPTRFTEADGTDTILLSGPWTPAAAQAVAARYKDKKTAPAPDRVPGGAGLELSADTLFPRRLTYWHEGSGGDGGEPGGRETVFALSFSHVEAGVPVPAGAFAYTPPDGAAEVDVTADAARRLRATADPPGPAAGPSADPAGPPRRTNRSGGVE